MRGVLSFLATLVIVALLAWIGLWWYAQIRLQTAFQSWADNQATHGLTISYATMRRGTSPLRAIVTYNGLTITLPPTANGAVPVVSLPTLALRIELTRPTTLNLDLPTKMTIDAGGSLDLGINLGAVALTETLDPNALLDKSVYPFRGGNFAASNIDVLASAGSLLILHIDSITSQAAISLAATSAQPALAETITTAGIALSPLLTRIASIPFDGRINQFNLSLNLSGPVPPGISALPDQMRVAEYDPQAQQKILIPLIHQWASGGGAGNFTATLAIGPSTANTAASIKFDANLQPAGTVSLTADHLDEFTAALTSAYPQLAPTIAQAEAQLTPYIAASPTAGQTLSINAAYGTGAVTINGTKIAPLPPLDWSALENPTDSGQ